MGIRHSYNTQKTQVSTVVCATRKRNNVVLCEMQLTFRLTASIALEKGRSLHMATPRQLVETVAEVLGISVATVIVHDRNLSTAPVPLRTVAGRGRAAARITAVDAANLLIAVAASESVKDSARTVLTYGGLRGGSRTTSHGHSSILATNPTGIRPVDALPVNPTLGELLAALIDAVGAEELRSKEFNSTVRFHGPRPSADIRWTFPDRRGKGHLREDEMTFKLISKTKSPGENGDMFRTTEFSEETVLRVGAIVGRSV
jgi:hypothetical protein